MSEEEKERKGENSPRTSRSSSPGIFENDFSDDEGRADDHDVQVLSETNDEETDLGANDHTDVNRKPRPGTDVHDKKIVSDDDEYDKDCVIESDNELDSKTPIISDTAAITLDEDGTEDEEVEKIEAEGIEPDLDIELSLMDEDIEEFIDDSDMDEEFAAADEDYIPALFDWDIPEDSFDNVIKPEYQSRRKKGQKNVPGNTRMTERIVEALKTKKHKFPRIFHSKSNPGRESSDDGYGSSIKKQMTLYSPMLRISSLAKQMQLDVTKLFEAAENIGFPLSFPCMQCFEKYGKGGDTYQDEDYYGYGGYERATDGRCQRCGGSVPTLSTYRQMILKMREKLQANNLVVHDVYPDGNCVFGAVIDQLRIRGDFRFTITTLRQGSVDYLRNNPESDDGTPYAMFLTEETWEDYLTRMSKDGVWGDHLVLNAIATIVNHQLIIYGGMVGDGETIIYPIGYKQTSEDDQVDVEAQPELNPLYLGHFGESHYISLRPVDWRESLQERINKSRVPEPEQSLQSLQELSNRTLPIYCDSMLRTLFLLEYVTSNRGDAIDVISPGREENHKFVYEMMGSVINKLHPSICEIESMAPDIDTLFPGSTETVPEKKKTLPRLVLFCTPSDTKVVFNPNNARLYDLISTRTESDLPGQTKLVPNIPDVWNSVLVKSKAGHGYIKTFQVDYEAYTSFPVLDEFPDIDVYPVIAFRCRWPDEAYDWISRQRNAKWLDDNFIRSMVTGYCHVVPVLSSEYLREITNDFASPDDVDGQNWVISFAAAEKRLLQKITSSQRHCFLLLQLYLSSLSPDLQLPPSVAKSIFFYACENIEASAWDLHPGVCFLKLLQNLVQALEEGVAPHFFIASKNLLQFVPREVTQELQKKIRSYCNQPFVGLFFFLDQFGITTSEVAPFLDGIIEDIFKAEHERDSDSYFLQVVLPSFSTMLDACSMQEQYRDAKLLANLVKEEVRRFCGEDMSIATILNSSLTDQHGGYRWCLALYMDLCNGTLLTTEVTGDRPTVSITEIFGPECTEELPDTRVDTMFKIQNGDLYFPKYVEAILHNLGKHRAITRCIRYYVDTLNDLAGDKLVLSTCPLHKSSPTSQVCCLSTIQSLYDLYLHLYNAYFQLNCVEEFRDLLPVLMKMAEVIGTSYSYRNLRLILRSLKEYDKAEELTSNMRSMKTRGTEAATSGLMQALTQVLSQGPPAYY